MKKQKNTRWAIINKIFLDNVIIAALIDFPQVGAGLIGGIVVKQMLSAESMAAYGLAIGTVILRRQDNCPKFRLQMLPLCLYL